MADEKCIVGIISDTHGLLRPEAEAALQGSDVIVHAGDVGDPEILTRLDRIAPVTVARGNVDREPWTSRLRDTEVVQARGLSLYVIHDLGALNLDPVKSGYGAVISGHSHHPLIEEKNGVLYINPGSAGARRFDLPATVARAEISGEAIDARIIELDV